MSQYVNQTDGSTIYIIPPKNPFDIKTEELMEPVRAATKKAADNAAAAARSFAPIKTGDLRRGIVPRGVLEKSQNPAKVGYDVWMDPKLNNVFVKMARSGVYKKGRRKGQVKYQRYYYPASQEYGFRTRGKTPRKVPGKRFLELARNAVQQGFRADVARAIEQAVVKKSERKE